ncbi:PduT-like ethanolamine utilization protein [Clostridium collagenovorans DSM 3089]|uniref:PduT-like ethanolamine utilization protein n=1 Tax=Clostridium collagenovorans DSM 3089 TaxID=1121306 RepID=A0A1M5TCP4_9CLOT|nr:BMC domain-containing protein [Clostridium collagenovorans]SHH48575.1 PduT-like ethanolamine utilization protein [Clostridium collagenovorans DSM 3089]
MFRALAIVELNSIAKGMEVADIMIKTSYVEVLTIKHICPGKFMIILNGDVEELNEAVKVIIDLGGKSLIGSYVIPNIHEEIVRALNKRVICNSYDAIGIMEVSSVTMGIVSLDKALKSGTVKLVKLVLGNGIGGKSYYVLTGSVSSVEEALKSAENVIEGKKLINKVIIPSPSEELLKSVF